MPIPATHTRQPGLVLIAIVLGIWACGRKDVDIVARMGDRVLTWEQLQSMIPDGTSASDSSVLAESYINSWAREQSIIASAEANLSAEKQNFEDLIDSYRKSLLIYAYEQEIVRQKLDTVVTDTEVEAYYEANKQNFQLRDYIVKVKFCALPSDHKELKSLRKLFLSPDPEDLVKWVTLCTELKASYFFDEDRWMFLKELQEQVPLEVFSAETFLKKNKTIEFEEGNNYYLLTITDFMLNGSVSPLSFEREKIRELILNQRKAELLNKMRDDLYSQALSKKEIEFFHRNEP
ncbi:MAG: peptidyl-prolyl cis-trans isomerase [Flavobacteriales bacterium]|nr:peptidyl-prolyl cis-trans isomerase [Flavobacteriales bacterium]